jgi:hypothetical protein
MKMYRELFFQIYDLTTNFFPDFRSHFKTCLIFLVFRVLLILGDIVTDLVTGNSTQFSS